MISIPFFYPIQKEDIKEEIRNEINAYIPKKNVDFSNADIDEYDLENVARKILNIFGQMWNSTTDLTDEQLEEEYVDVSAFIELDI